MLFLIIRLGRIEGYRSHGAHRLADLIVAKCKRGIIKLIAPAIERLKGLSIRRNHAAGRTVHHLHILRPALPDHGQFAAGNDNAFPINHTDCAVRVLL